MSRRFTGDIGRYDLQRIDSINADTCEQKCRENGSCVFTNHVTNRNECWLKNPYRDNNNATLGIKNDTPLYYKRAMDIGGMDIGISSSANNVFECHEKCKNEPRCHFYAFLNDNKQCYLKGASGSEVTTRFIWRNESEIFDCQQEVDIRARPDICAVPVCTKNDGSGLNKQACKDWCRTSGGKCDNAAKAYCSANPNDKDFCGVL